MLLNVRRLVAHWDPCHPRKVYQSELEEPRCVHFEVDRRVHHSLVSASELIRSLRDSVPDLVEIKEALAWNMEELTPLVTPIAVGWVGLGRCEFDRVGSVQLHDKGHAGHDPCSTWQNRLADHILEDG